MTRNKRGKNMKDWNTLTPFFRAANICQWQGVPAYRPAQDNADWWKAQYQRRAEDEWKSWRIPANTNRSPALQAALNAVEAWDE